MTESSAPAESETPLPDGIGSLQTPVGWFMRPAFRFLWKFDVQGRENVPATGGAVICANHLAAIDSFVVPAVLPRSIMYVGKSEYLDDWKTAKLFPRLGMIPIDRRGGDHAKGALDAARQVLAKGGLFGIYPEGTRSRSGRLHKGHTGAARLAIETGCPIVPVGLIGTPEIQPPDQAIPNFFRRATISFGEPIDVSRYAGRVGDRVVYRELIDEVMFEIGRLSGQDYDDTYAGSTAAGPDTVGSGTVGSDGTAASEKTAASERTVADESITLVDRPSSASVIKTRPLVAA